MTFFSSRGSHHPRPPTPPREVRDDVQDDIEKGLDDTLDFLSSGVEVELVVARPKAKSLAAHTPPTSSPEVVDAATRKERLKKVDFAPFIEYDWHSAPAYSAATLSATPLRPLPPSRERRPVKSILKPFTQATVVSASTKTYDSLPEMLDFTIQQLSGKDATSRLDAYRSCLATMQAFDSVPDTQSLVQNASTLLTFIIRDVRGVTSAPLNVPLITASLKFLINLLRIPEVNDCLDVDECGSLVEHSLSVIRDKAAPKAIVQHHLFMLCQQKFSPKVMTADRANRILDALRTIHERVTGNGVKAHRLLIYRRFCDQIPAVMVEKCQNWIEPVYLSMLSSKSDLRQYAIEIGLNTSIRFGTHAEVARGVHDLLFRHLEGKAFQQFVLDRLILMLKEKDIASSVPRIWSVTVMYLRARARKPNHWNDVKPWLGLIQRCLNSSNSQIKFESNLAWNRFIFAANLDQPSLPQVRALLRAPLEAQIAQSREGDFSRGVDRSVLSSYVCLLYYSLRPGTSSAQLDIYWKDYVTHTLTMFLGKTGDHFYYACSILRSLFEPSERWAENRANEEPLHIDLEELPQLAPKWIRSRISEILSFLQAFLSTPECWLPIDGERQGPEAPSNTLAIAIWKALMSAVREAGLKEVTVSIELKSAIASIVNSLHQMWVTTENGHDSTNAIASLTEVAITELGASIFTEKMLARNSTDNFEVAPTPSHRLKNGRSSQSAMMHLFTLQISPPPASRLPISKIVAMARSLMQHGWQARNSRKGRLDLLGDFAATISHAASSGASSELLAEISDAIVNLCESAIPLDQPSFEEPASQLAQDSAEIFRIIRFLIPYLKELPARLYGNVVSAVKQSSGSGGVLLAVTEPHSSMISDFMSQNISDKPDFLLRYTALILEKDSRPRNWGAIERGRKSLWGGVSPVPNRAKIPDLEHTKLSSLVNLALIFGYSHLDENTFSGFTQFLKSLNQYIKSSLPASSIILLRQIQAGLASLLKDDSRLIKNITTNSENQGLLSDVSTPLLPCRFTVLTLVKIMSLWKTAIDIIQAQQRRDVCVQAFQVLIIAGLSSPRRSIANGAITFWNQLLRGEEDFPYSEDLARVLRRLRLVADIETPAALAQLEDDKVC
jgi:Rap1-interacting factor 1 N terminal